MSIGVWDTYVERADGRKMHFDILVPAAEKDEARVFAFGNNYLERKGITGTLLSAEHCSFCHIEQGTEAQLAAIGQDGYFIIEMEHCN